MEMSRDAGSIPAASIPPFRRVSPQVAEPCRTGVFSCARPLACDSQPVTDAGLEHLKGLTNLDVLVLAGTDVTDTGVAELKKALSKCDIRR